MRLHVVRFIVGLLLVPTVLALPPVPQRYVSRRAGNWTVGQVVDTTSGPVTGHAASNNTQVSEYLGIPYAKPPVDDLRWQPPVEYTGTAPINGTTFPLYNLSRGGYYVTPDVLLPDTPQSEDCLTLNVWTDPQKGESSKAVLVYIHGGSYTGGSSSEKWFNGQFMAEEQDVVVVTINYRLNIFGFPGNPTTELNLGILDQRMAVEWVRDNIASFGGDPNRIVMFGQSAGAASVDIHSYAYASDPIASGYVMQSGTAWGFGVQTQKAASDLWYLAAHAVGCHQATEARVFACMQSIPASVLIKRLPPIRYGMTPGLPYGPVADGKLVFADYSDRSPAARPVLVGNTDDESGLSKHLTPWWAGLPHWYWPVQNIFVFTCPAGQRAAVSVSKGNPTWRYRWFGAFPNTLLPWIPYNGSWHGSELPSIFNTAPQQYYTNTQREKDVGTYMRGAWAAFAKDPVHGLHKYDGWENYKPNGTTLIRLAHAKQANKNGTWASFSMGPSRAYDDDCVSA
ncbi:hypothetical protein PFICI_12579 [Pestalotiopsis fici W106-1]|uniref:Carboxylesterase type B domain-containing protein n=1 Tax=Pestalotiopsis fici (strain W106-1 / CGMCC3.15140) TaxID=1229662 RepID=W3WP00_PESFW|nr:uncharacterized protein PFICI_12579 [Pestalotiopsis fici W106-1]ETS75635.1 hypothetical protein PFICI_12579 [Pestalotiopsis fici W106-1]